MTPQKPASSEMVSISRGAWELWRAECHKPQFLTISSGGGQPCKVTFTYTGFEALKRGQDMHEALNAIALAALEPLASAPRPSASDLAEKGDSGAVLDRLRSWHQNCLLYAISEQFPDERWGILASVFEEAIPIAERAAALEAKRDG